MEKSYLLLEKAFNGHEIDMLISALITAIYNEKLHIEVLKRLIEVDGDDFFRKRLEMCLKNLDDFKSLLRRFLPNLTDEELFGGEADEK